LGKITHYIGLEDSRYVKFINSGIQEFINYLKEQGVLKVSIYPLRNFFCLKTIIFRQKCILQKN